MKLERLITFFATDPAAKLLRADSAAYVIYFLHQHFKAAGNLSTPHSQLQQRLSQFLEQTHETAPDVLRERAEAYLTQWSTGERRWLNRSFDAEHAEPIYQLTPPTEDVLQFLTEVLDRDLGFVGTESRLKRIIDTLSDIVVHSSDDPQRRLEHLRAERERIDQEIAAIESGKAVGIHSPTALRERFADAVSDLVSLQSDFRAVEESFKHITRDVQKQQAESADSRGEILGFALDAEDRLKADDQGVSFHEFVRLILSQSKQDELEAMIAQLEQIEELAQQAEGMAKVRHMIRHLSGEAEKVLRTTRRLSATLRRLLDARTTGSRQRLAAVLREIQTAAARCSENPPAIGVDVRTELELLNVSQRTFWESPIHFEQPPLSNKQVDEDDRQLAFRHLAGLQRLDWESMRANISQVLQTREQTALPDLLAIHPSTSGAVEVLGYIQLAVDDGHEVDENRTEVVYLRDEDADDEQSARPFEIPRVVFLSERLRALRNHLRHEVTS